MQHRPISLQDQVFFRHILTTAGYEILALSEIRTVRDGSASAIGAFRYFGNECKAVNVKQRRDKVYINDREHHWTINDDGTVNLFIAHCDGPY